MLNGITRRDIVGDVLTLFDYVEELERENERLKKERNTEPKKGINYVDTVMIERGKKEIFDEVFRNWGKVQCTYNEDKEVYEFTPFNKWLEHKLDMDYMPKTLSFDDFMLYFKQELQERYAKEKDEALKKAKEE